MAKYKVLYTDSGMSDVDIEKEVLSKVDAEIIMCSATDEDTLIKEGEDCVGIMVEYANISSRVLDAWGAKGKVKVISRQGIGVDNIDIDAAGRNGIMVANVPDYCIDEVADHAMALALCVAREIKSFGKKIESGIFVEDSVRPIYRLRGRNFCVYGFGNIAKQVAKRAQAFGMKTYTYDPFVSEDVCKEYNTEKVNDLFELAEMADIFSIHVPLTESTKHSIDMEVMKNMKKNCIIVNTSRGGIIDENDLIEALNRNIIAGAGLDVFEEEPPANDLPLLHMDNVVVTSHVSFYSEEANVELRRGIAENVAFTIETGKPKSLVNKKYFK